MQFIAKLFRFGFCYMSWLNHSACVSGMLKCMYVLFVHMLFTDLSCLSAIGWVCVRSTAAPYTQSTQFAYSQGGTIPVAKKKKYIYIQYITFTRHSHARARSHLMFAAECKWSELMDNYAREKTSAIRRQEKKKKRWKRASLSGRLHS